MRKRYTASTDQIPSVEYYACFGVMGFVGICILAFLIFKMIQQFLNGRTDSSITTEGETPSDEVQSECGFEMVEMKLEEGIVNEALEENVV